MKGGCTRQDHRVEDLDKNRPGRLNDYDVADGPAAGVLGKFRQPWKRPPCILAGVLLRARGEGSAFLGGMESARSRIYPPQTPGASA